MEQTAISKRNFDFFVFVFVYAMNYKVFNARKIEEPASDIFVDKYQREFDIIKTFALFNIYINFRFSTLNQKIVEIPEVRIEFYVYQES